MIKDKNKVLFACTENSCRSQMAEGWARYLGKDVVLVYSAGSKPSGIVDPDAIKIMSESGIDISKRKSKGFDDLPVSEFDYVVTMGCSDTCPFVPARRHMDWGIDDPKGKDLEFFRRVRDEIKFKVSQLINEIAADKN